MFSRLLATLGVAFCGLCAGANQQVTVSAQCNPFLAGQPNGTTSKTDVAPAQSPRAVPIVGAPGSLRFPSVNGQTSYGPAHPYFGPDGGFQQPSASDLGISGYTMPVCALLGVFLPDTTNTGAAPPSLDFSLPGGCDFMTLAPQLFQTFFIGDGRRTDGTTLQSFFVPPGATRLFLGICDGHGWHNNLGELSVEIEGLPPIPCDVLAYCTPKVNSLGCVPTIAASSELSLSGADECFITAQQVCNYRPGMLIWGRAPAAIPYQGGTLCIAAPRHRTQLQDSGGNLGGDDCSGSYEFHASQAFLAANSLNVGETLHVQYWCRDPGSQPFGSGFTSALALPVCP